MRAGKLDRTIKIQTYGPGEPDANGTVTSTWTDFATMRAQIVQASTDEYLAGYGEAGKTVVIFRTRWRAGVTTTHRVQYEGRNLNIRETKEIGRRRGLELRCEEVRT